MLGGQSRALTALFTGPGRNWNFVPTATLPIFDAGRIRNNVRLTEAQRKRSAGELSEVDPRRRFGKCRTRWSGCGKPREQRAQEELLVKALEDADRLSTLRYRGGLDSYLQVLDAERNLFQGQLDLARLRQR